MAVVSGDGCPDEVVGVPGTVVMVVGFGAVAEVEVAVVVVVVELGGGAVPSWRHLARSSPTIEQTMGRPSWLTPRAPTGAQYAPGVTVRSVVEVGSAVVVGCDEVEGETVQVVAVVATGERPPTAAGEGWAQVELVGAGSRSGRRSSERLDEPAPAPGAASTAGNATAGRGAGDSSR